jgi:hypothetical protein
MPYGQIYWNHYGGGNVANTGFAEFSNAHDVRFGKTASEDSHSAFSFAGNRRTVIQDWWQVFVRDTRFPLSLQNIDNAYPSGTEYWTGVNSPIVYGWPGVNTYGSAVNSMTIAALTATNGYPNKRNQSGTLDHSTLTDDLFQAQNRESCHHLSNVALSHNLANPFVGIHKDNPLKLTTTKKYEGYRLILKRKRYYYNELRVRLIQPSNMGTEGFAQFVDVWDSTSPEMAAPNTHVYNNIRNNLPPADYPKYSPNTKTSDLVMNVNGAFNNLSTPAAILNVFRTQVPAPGAMMTDTSNPNGDTQADYDRMDNPWIQSGGSSGGGNFNWSSALAVSDAVLHPQFNVRTERWAGSVYLKNITIKTDGNVLSAQDDINGQYAEVPSSEIYTDQSAIKASSSGSGNKIITFSNLYNSRTDIIKRYISTDFKIKFQGSSTEYEIASVSNTNTITLSTNATSFSNKTFTLLIPRGSTNANYTWGNYKLSNFDDDTYDTTVCEEIPNSGDLLTFDLLPSTPNLTAINGNAKTFHTIMNQVEAGTSGGKEGVPIRHPYWSNELSEALHIRKDYSHLAYWERYWFEASCGQYMHVAAMVENPTTDNPNWNKCSWVNYWEISHTSGLSATTTTNYNDSGFSNLKATNLHVGDGGGANWMDAQLLRRDVADAKPTIDSSASFIFNTKQFHYKGIDKASGSLWPSYKNNIAALNPTYFNQTFTSDRSEWLAEYTEAFKVGGTTPSVANEIDKCWFSGSAIRLDPSVKSTYGFPRRFGGAFTFSRALVLTLTSAGYTNTNANKAAAWLKVIKHKTETTLYHPWTLAQYGFGSDMLGWQEYFAKAVGSGQTWAYHTFTIYDTDDILSSGVDIEVSLHQASPPWNAEMRDDWGRTMEEPPLLGYGQSVKPLDNYQLFIVAK